MPRWLQKAIARIHVLASAGALQFTDKALREMESLRLTPPDVADILATLTRRDSAGRRISGAAAEWLYVFTPDVGGERIYVKVVLRDACVVISFHEDGGATDESPA